MALSPHPHKLYVGNLPPHITESKLAHFFNNKMVQKGVAKDNNPTPVISVQLNKEKNYAFIEFGCAEDATAAMEFDNIILEGYQLKVRCTRDDRPTKIFIGGLPYYLTEDQVKELVSTFGPLKCINLCRDTLSGLSKGYGFFEYVDGEVTDRAVAALNGLIIGEKTIIVQRVVGYLNSQG